MKKVLWIIVLIIVLFALIMGITSLRKQDAKTGSADKTFNKDSNTAVTITSNTVKSENKAEEKTVSESTTNKEFIETKSDDGILYSVDGKEVKADIVVTDNYYDTTINDMWINPDSYKGKTVQIEGMYFENLPYTFVGRYAVSNVCPNCPPGYSYFEYELNGNIDRTFKDSEDWIKIVGTFSVGNDASTNYEDFYYLDVLSLEVMNEKGQETVYN